MKKKALIFDFDGTLTDSGELESHTMAEAVRRFSNPDFKDFEIFKFYGPTETGILRKLIPENKINEALSFFYSYYDSYQREIELKHLDGIFSLIEEYAKSTKIFILTGRSSETLKLTLAYFSWPSCTFEDLYCGSDEGVIKAENIIKLCEKHNLTADEIVYIGDSLADIREMRKADVDIISAGYYRSSDYNSELEKNNKGMVAKDIKELKELIDKLI